MATVVKTNNDSVSLPAINGLGQHTLTLSTMDYAGNETVITIKFEIKNSDQQNEDMASIVKTAVEKSQS